MPYSWDEPSKAKKKHKTFNELQEELDHFDDETASVIGGYRPKSHSGKHGSGNAVSSVAKCKTPVRKNWAKIIVSIREEEVEKEED